MRKLIFIVIIAALAAVGILYGLRQAQRTTPAAVVALLPRGTIALVHMPDCNRTRDEWHQSDVYQLYREPAVQDFLQRPLTRMPQRDATSETLREIEQLNLKDAFIAVTSIDNNNPRFAGGFRFRGSQDDAEKTIGKWRSQLVTGASTGESVEYQQHKIEIVGAAPNQVATAYDGDWFFASNDLAELKTILDRADRRTQDRQSILEADDAFRSATAHMLSGYALLFYLKPKAFTEKFASLRAAIAEQVPLEQHSLLEQIGSICGTTRFDKGKIHDALFIGMPKSAQNASLTRSSLQLGTRDTFLYLATLLNFEKLASLSQAGGRQPFTGWLEKVFDISSRAGVTLKDWKAGFELELASLADWPENARWPSLVATIPVKNPVRAGKIVSTLTSAIDEDVSWTRTEKNGVQYFFMPTPGAWFANAPTIALSNRILVAGLDSVSVEAAIKRTQSSASDLSNSRAYQAAARAVPAPTSFFAYIDTALLYSRLDAALRPMLVMSAAFMPAISDYVDAAKLPAPELVTKHLSPIVSSQRYDGDGYVVESVGPITLNQAAIGLGLPAIFWTIAQQQKNP
jgi:hypothetical protein